MIDQYEVSKCGETTHRDGWTDLVKTGMYQTGMGKAMAECLRQGEQGVTSNRCQEARRHGPWAGLGTGQR